MTMTIEKIEFPRRESKQTKSRKSLTIDSEDELLVSPSSIEQVIPVIQPEEKSIRQADKALAMTTDPIPIASSDPKERFDPKERSEPTDPIATILIAFENHLMEDAKGTVTIASYTGASKASLCGWRKRTCHLSEN